jgi:hypothetical protein
MEETVLLGPDGHAAGGCAEGGEPSPVHSAAPRRLVLPRRPERQATDRATCPCQSHVGASADQQLLRASCSARSLRQPVRRHARTALGVDVEDPTLILPPFRHCAVMRNGVASASSDPSCARGRWVVCGPIPERWRLRAGGCGRPASACPGSPPPPHGSGITRGSSPPSASPGPDCRRSPPRCPRLSLGDLGPPTPGHVGDSEEKGARRSEDSEGPG